jgi:hypothetical protein
MCLFRLITPEQLGHPMSPQPLVSIGLSATLVSASEPPFGFWARSEHIVRKEPPYSALILDKPADRGQTQKGGAKPH